MKIKAVQGYGHTEYAEKRDKCGEQKKKQYGLKTDIIIADDLISDGVSKETTQAVIDFIKNKNKSKH